MSKKIAPVTVTVAAAAAGLGCLVPLGALAQAAAAAASPASAAQPQDAAHVIITAQKRKEDIRDVPLSVSVVTAEQLSANQIGNVEDLTRNLPNVSFSTQAGPGLGTIEIRGVSSQAGSATVSVYLDDVSLTTRNLYSTGTAEPRFFDLDHVEVLRGPQGTLYGASSLGGTIKFISKQPDLRTLGGSAAVSLSGTQSGGFNWSAEGVINVPLKKDTAALRIGVQHGHESGFIDLVDPTTLRVTKKNIDSDDWTVAKGALRLEMGNGWSITPAFFGQVENTQDIDAAWLTTLDDTPLGKFQTAKTVREPGRDRLEVPSVTLTGETSFGTFTGVLSGYMRRFDRVQDGTYVNGLGGRILNGDSALDDAIASLPSAVQLRNKIDQTSLELRMASKDYDPASANPFTWIVGGFVSDAVTQVYDNEPIFGVNAAFQAAGENIEDPGVLKDAFPDDFIGDSSYYSARHYHDKQASVFGELTWHVTPKLAATVGLRELTASQHFEREGGYYWNHSNQFSPSAVIDTASAATTPSFKLNWAASRDLSLYGNISKGFRLGAANRPIPLDNDKVQADIATLGLPGPPPKTFAPDTLWSYEVGEKASFWNRAVALNVSLFYLDWKNIQQDVTLPSSGFDFETNVGRARSYGIEADVRGRVNANLTLTAAAGYTHAEFAGDVPLLGSDDAGVPNVRKGDPIQGVPRYSASLGADWHWALTDAVNAFVRGNGQWTGSSHGSLLRGDPDRNRPGYFTLDASTGVNFDRWEITAFVKNATNNQTAIQHPSIQYVSEAYYLRPRTIGMTASYEF